MRKNYLISYAVALYSEYLLDFHFITDTLEEVEHQIDDHFRDCCPLVYESVIKKREDFPYIFQVYELSLIYRVE